MACVTLKRAFEFDSTYNTRPTKRPRYTSVQSSPSGISTNLNSTNEKVSPTKQQSDSSSPFCGISNKTEKMASSVEKNAKRLNCQKHQQLNNSTYSREFSQDSPSSQDKPLFTFSQVLSICKKMLKEQEEKIREEYEKDLNDKLVEQYDTFIKFTQDQLQNKINDESRSSYLS